MADVLQYQKQTFKTTITLIHTDHTSSQHNSVHRNHIFSEY